MPHHRVAKAAKILHNVFVVDFVVDLLMEILFMLTLTVYYPTTVTSRLYTTI